MLLFKYTYGTPSNTVGFSLILDYVYIWSDPTLQVQLTFLLLIQRRNIAFAYLYILHTSHKRETNMNEMNVIVSSNLPK